MTGFAQPPDPDDDPAGAERAAAQPMQPADPVHPDEQDVDDAADEERVAAQDQDSSGIGRDE